LIYFLVDSSAVWRLQRQPELTEAWNSSLLSGAVGSCEPQRAEFRRSARNADEFDQMNQMFRDVYPDVPVPKSVCGGGSIRRSTGWQARVRCVPYRLWIC
jgi:hypothetical protein